MAYLIEMLGDQLLVDSPVWWQNYIECYIRPFFENGVSGFDTLPGFDHIGIICENTVDENGELIHLPFTLVFETHADATAFILKNI